MRWNFEEYPDLFDSDQKIACKELFSFNKFSSADSESAEILEPAETLECYATRETDTSGKPYVRIYLMNLTDELQAAFQRKLIRAYLLP